MATSDVGDPGAGLQFSLDALERGNPVWHQIGVVARPEELFRTREQALRMLVPADTFAGAKSIRDLGLVEIGGLNDFECSGKESGRAFLGERHGLLGRERKGLLVRIEVDVSG